MVVIFSWVLACTSIYSTIILGNKKHSGWIYAFINTFLWAVYSALTKQWALVLLNIVMAGVQVQNYRKWKL